MNRAVRAVVAAGSATALLLAGLVACGEDDEPGEGGDELGARVALAEGVVAGGREDVVQLPGGQLAITVDPDLGASLSEEASVDRLEHEAGQDLRYVGVTWDERTGVGVPAWLRVLLDDASGTAGDPDTLAVTLVADEERIPLGTPVTAVERPQDLTSYDHLAVAVPAEAEDLSLEIDFSGAVQTVDLADGAVDPGLAAPLYDLPAEQAAGGPCGGAWVATPGGAPATVECQQLAFRLPYVAGLGWVEDPDRPWVVVNASTFLESYQQDGSTYAPREQQDATTVGGQTAARVLSELADDQQVDTYAVFPASEDRPTVSLARDVAFELLRGRGPDVLERTFTLQPGLVVPGAESPFAAS